MAADFGARPIALSIGLIAYMLAGAVFIPLSGWSAGRLGARNVFCAAIVVFTLANLSPGGICILGLKLIQPSAHYRLWTLPDYFPRPLARLCIGVPSERDDTVK